MDQNILANLKSSTRRAAGKRAKKGGSRFEDSLEGMHRIYRNERRAVVKQLHKPIGGWGAKMFIKGRAPIDFSGHLPGGRCVYIEAKSTALDKVSGKPKGTLPIDTAYALKPCNGIQFEQVEELQLCAATGALCLIAWWNGIAMGVFVVPAGWQPSGVSMSREQFTWMEPGSYDWLGVVGKGGAV